MSWFTDIYHYARHGPRESLEGYSTGMLGFLMDIDEDLLASFWRTLMNSAPDGELEILHQCPGIDPESGNPIYTDLIIEDVEYGEDDDEKRIVNRVLVIEAKIDSPLRRQQLDCYERWAKSEYSDAHEIEVIGLVVNKPSRKQLRKPGTDTHYACITWWNIRKLIEDLESSKHSKTLREIRENFIEFLEEKNMASVPPPQISEDYKTVVGQYEKFRESFEWLHRKIISLLNGGSTEGFQFREKTYWYFGARYNNNVQNVTVYLVWDSKLGGGDNWVNDTGDLGVGIVCGHNPTIWEQFEDIDKYIMVENRWGSIEVYVSLNQMLSSETDLDFYSKSLDKQAKILAEAIRPVYEFAWNAKPAK